MFPEVQVLAHSGALMPDIQPIPALPLRHHRPGRVRECKVCLGEHDQDTHDATVRIHGWFRGQVVRNFE